MTSRSLQTRLLLLPFLAVAPIIGYRTLAFPDGVLAGWAVGTVVVAAAWVLITRRPLQDMGFRWGRAGLSLMAGGGGALACLGLPTLLLWGTGRVQVLVGHSEPSSLLLPGVALGVAALGEEVLFRGYLLTTLEEKLSPRRAILVGGVLFGAGHLFNPHAGFLGFVGVVSASFILGILYQGTRSLLASTTFHLTWNAGLSMVMGLPVSGMDLPAGDALLPVRGQESLLGLPWGPEAGWPYVLTLLGVGWALHRSLPPRRVMDDHERAWESLMKEEGKGN